MAFFLRLHITIIIVLTLSAFSFAQNQSSSPFNDILNSLIDKEPNYETVEDSFLEFQNDSIKMNSLYNTAKVQNHFLLQGFALNALGVIQRDVSNYEAALNYHKKAEVIAKDIKNLELEVVSLNMLGVVYRRMDVVKPALDSHAKAFELASDSDIKNKILKHNIAVSHNSMGNIYLTLKQYDLALKQFNQSLIIETEENNKLGLAINYQNIGFAEEANGDIDKALDNYKRSLEYNELINSNLGRVICYNSIGQVYIKQGKYQDAKPLLEDALKKALQIKDQFYISSSYLNLGWLKMELGYIKSAEQDLNIGLQTANTYNLQTSIVQANTLLSNLYIKKGNYEKALNYYKAAVNLDNTISSERNVQYANDIILQFETDAKNREIAALANENELVKSKLEQNKKVFWYALLGLALFASIIIAYNRTQQLKNEKHILTLEQDMLQSQMNPHFIFNSLNSIKLYIINNEKENAVYYLNKFSKLIRKILVASTEKNISLENELETMALYMNIENIRFSNAITFDINVADDVDTSRIKLPSLILQPFLENSLWHGLSTKKDDKRITLDVTKQKNDYVIISITDNGVGRRESERIKNEKILKRKSVGIDITKARLANFSKNYFGDYNLEIKDLYNHKGLASGTKVTLKIPITQINLKTA